MTSRDARDTPPAALPSAPTTLATALEAWFAQHRRPLPWRVGVDGARPAYRVWLAEVMLQQTRVSVVVDYWNRFVARFPDVKDLAAAPEDEVLSLWSGLGYYARGRNLHKAAKAVVADCGGVFPTSSAELKQLPGVGDYTAAAVAAFAGNERTAVLDGNVARVLSRLCDDATPIDGPRGKARFTALAQALVDVGSSASLVNEGLMELGALVCTPKSPSCGSCPWSSSCRGKSRAAELPKKAKKQARKAVVVAVVVVVDPGGAVWLEKRAAAGLFGGLWEPPGVVVDSSADVAAAWRAVLAERGLPVPVSFPAPVLVERTLTHRELRFEVAVLTTTTPTPTPTLPPAATGQWFSAAAVGEVGTSTAVRAVLSAAREPRLF